MSSESRDLPTAADILHRFHAAEKAYMSAPPSQRDFSGMAAVLSADMKLYQSPDLPYGGEYVGLSGFLEWSEAMAERFDIVEVIEPKILEGGDDVVVLGTVRLRVKKTGEEWKKFGVQVVKVDREEGVITEIRPFYWDVAGLNTALSK